MPAELVSAEGVLFTNEYIGEYMCRFEVMTNKKRLNTMLVLSLHWEVTAAHRIPNHPDGISGSKMKATAAKL